jgi:hypothetical protein
VDKLKRVQYVTALEQTLQFLREEEGKSHQGYYSSGWAGRQLQDLKNMIEDPSTVIQEKLA